VQLVGDFTHWQSKPVNLVKQADGVWKTSIALAAGTYHYRFLVDGTWCDDPQCLTTTATTPPPKTTGQARKVKKTAKIERSNPGNDGDGEYHPVSRASPW
jgi:1,4-alpha-glucan branching enzyme